MLVTVTGFHSKRFEILFFKQNKRFEVWTFIFFSPLVAGSNMPSLLALEATFFARANFHFLSDSKSCQTYIYHDLSYYLNNATSNLSISVVKLMNTFDNHIISSMTWSQWVLGRRGSLGASSALNRWKNNESGKKIVQIKKLRNWNVKNVCFRTIKHF